jgi:hypothetical protein
MVDWRMYLLPSGESTFLGGVKSMVVDPFPPEELLSQRLLRRNFPLLDQKILVVTGKTKAKKESKVPCNPYVTNPSVITTSFFMLWGRDKFSAVQRSRTWMTTSLKEGSL